MAATIGTLIFEPLPPVNADAPTTEEIRRTLIAHPGEWAIVHRADRFDRAQQHADRITSGAVFGPGFEAAARSLGSRADARTYARFVGA